MNLPKRFATLLATLALTTVVGCAATATREGTGEYVDDTVITTKVKAAIFNEPTLKSADINVETFRGSVQLTGFVNSRENMTKAVDLTRNVSGVKAVKDDMRLKN